MTRVADRLLSLFVPTTTAAASPYFCERCASSTYSRLCAWRQNSNGTYTKVCSGCGSC
jgi:hypothetical protein